MPEDGNDTAVRPLHEVEDDIAAERQKGLSLRASSIVSFATSLALGACIYAIHTEPAQEVLSTHEDAERVRAETAQIIPLIESGEVLTAADILERTEFRNSFQIAGIYDRALEEGRTLDTENSNAARHTYTIDTGSVISRFREAADARAVDIERNAALIDKAFDAVVTLFSLASLGVAWRGGVQWNRASRSGRRLTGLRAEARLARLEKNLDRIAVNPS